MSAGRLALPPLLSLVVAVTLSGCCGHLRCSRKAISAAVPPEVAMEFDWRRVSEAVVGEEEVERKQNYALTRFELSGLTNGSATNRPLVLDCFLPLQTTNPPVIMILPMLGGSYPLERFFAKYFAKHGLASVLVHREKYDGPGQSAEELEYLFRQTVLDNKRAIDWLETRKEIDVSRLGVFGISLGAIKAALLTPLEPRVDATVLALPAGDLPYILTYTTERGIARRRAELLRERQWTEQQLREHLESILTCDPMRYAPYVDPKKVLMVLAAWDSTVPIKKGLELRKAMHKPETIFVASGHYTAAIYLPYLRYATVRFFKDRLKENEEAAKEVAGTTNRRP